MCVCVCVCVCGVCVELLVEVLVRVCGVCVEPLVLRPCIGPLPLAADQAHRLLDRAARWQSACIIVRMCALCLTLVKALGELRSPCSAPDTSNTPNALNPKP